MLAGDQGVGLIEVRPELVGRPGLARVVPRDRQAAAEGLAVDLEAADVVPLPAVERDGDGREPFEGAVDVDAEPGIAFPGRLEGPLDGLFLARHDAFALASGSFVRRQGFRPSRMGFGQVDRWESVL